MGKAQTENRVDREFLCQTLAECSRCLSCKIEDFSSKISLYLKYFVFCIIHKKTK